MADGRQDYPAILKRVSPIQAVDVLSARVQQVGRLNLAIADWLQDRRRLEEQYAAGLRKLAHAQIDPNDLGIFSVPWTQITTAMEALAESHASLSSGVGVEVEKPLRDYANHDPDLQNLGTVRPDLLTIANDFERAQQKADKLQSRGDNLEASKVAAVSSELDQARAQWEKQAPGVFEKLQILDETRLGLLRDHLTQLQTLEADQVEKNRVAAELSLNALLNVETQDEIKTFAIKASSINSGLTRARRSSLIGAAATPARTPLAATSFSNIIPASGEKENDSSATPEGGKKGLKSGLKRLGTVMGRKTKQSAQVSATTETPDRKSKSFNSFGKLGRSKDSYQGSLEPTQEEPSSQRPLSSGPLPTVSNNVPESVAESAADEEPPSQEAATRSNGFPSPPVATSGSLANGVQRGLTPVQSPQSATNSVLQSPEVPQLQGAFSISPQSPDPISQAQAEAAMLDDAAQPQFNVNIRTAPIQEEGGDVALANVANKLQAPPPATRRAGTVRGRRDNRNSAIVSPHGGSEQPAFETASAAMPVSEVEATPAASLQISSPPSSQSNRASALFNSGPIASAGAPTFPANVIPTTALNEPLAIRPSSKQTIAAADLTGDNQSIRSGRSLTSTGSQGLKHPELTETGLSSSIIETISARFENGQLLSSSLIGEVALAYNAPDFTTPFGHETVRLDNFGSLEKVAPNPAFVTQVARRDGEYTINLGSIARTQLAFKYQFGHDQTVNQVPILVSTALKVEPTQISVIVTYSLHPNFALRMHESLSISNLTLALNLEGARASGCQSKPVGTFSREKNVIFWQLGDVILSPHAPPQKLLARFATESEARGASVESKWEITGRNSQGLGSGLAVSVLSSSTGTGEGTDPFADEDAYAAGASWKPVHEIKKLISGNYSTKS